MPLEVVKRVKKKILYIVYSRIKYRTHLYKYSVFSKTVVYLTQADLPVTVACQLELSRACTDKSRGQRAGDRADATCPLAAGVHAAGRGGLSILPVPTVHSGIMILRSSMPPICLPQCVALVGGRGRVRSLTHGLT